MTILGLIGGLGPETTVEYYRLLIARYRERTGGRNPAIIINSVDLSKLLGWMNAHELDKATDYISAELERLHLAGADIAALASNTPHIVFDELQRRSPLRLFSIVEATRRKVESLNLKTVGLLGTRFTMQAPFYPDVLAKSGIKVLVPTNDEQAYIHDKYINELLNNIFLQETRTEILKIVDTFKERDGIQGVVLGGTELPLLLRDQQHNSLPLLDTSQIHVEALVEEMLK